MTLSTLKKTFTYLALAFLICSCQSARESRIAANPEIFATLNTEEQEAVQRGVILKEMSTDAVYLALGRPSETSTGSQDDHSVDTWIYRGVRAVPGYRDAMIYDPYAGGYYFQPVPDYDYIPYNRAIVTFLNEQVVSVQQRR